MQELRWPMVDNIGAYMHARLGELCTSCISSVVITLALQCVALQSCTCRRYGKVSHIGTDGLTGMLHVPC